MDVLTAEGIGYLENQLEECGCVLSKNDGKIAFHTELNWNDCLQLFKERCGMMAFFPELNLIGKTKMADGRTNFIFVIGI